MTRGAEPGLSGGDQSTASGELRSSRWSRGSTVSPTIWGGGGGLRDRQEKIVLLGRGGSDRGEINQVTRPSSRYDQRE